MTTVIAHISDPHFGSESPRLVEALNARLDEIRPDLIIASGDFTTAGRASEFETAARFIADLPAPVVATPGNHDIPAYNLFERFTDPLRRYRAWIAPRSYTRYRSPHAHLLSLNTARSWNPSLNWAHGRISNRQIASAEQFFSASDDSVFRALVVHHPFWVPREMRRFQDVANGPRMLQTLARRGVRAVFAGHLHRNFRAASLVELDSGSHEILLIQASTATSERRRDLTNAFNLVHVNGDDITVTPQVWDGACFHPEQPKVIEERIRFARPRRNQQRSQSQNAR